MTRAGDRSIYRGQGMSARPTSSLRQAGAPEQVAAIEVAPLVFAGRERVRWTALRGLIGSVLMLCGSVGSGGKLIRDPLLDGTPLIALRFGHGYYLAVVITSSRPGAAGLVLGAAR